MTVTKWAPWWQYGRASSCKAGLSTRAGDEVVSVVERSVSGFVLLPMKSLQVVAMVKALRPAFD